MSKGKITPGDWSLGEKEIDRGEYGWDGKVWAPAPPPYGLEETDPDEGPQLVASVERIEDAQLILAAKAMLAALEPFAIEVPDAKQNETFQVTCGGRHLRAVCAAIAKANMRK